MFDSNIKFHDNEDSRKERSMKSGLTRDAVKKIDSEQNSDLKKIKSIYKCIYSNTLIYYLKIMKTVLIAHESDAEFTHVDLHTGNVMVLKPEKNNTDNNSNIVKLFDFDFSAVMYRNKMHVSVSRKYYTDSLPYDPGYLIGKRGFLFDFYRLLLHMIHEIRKSLENTAFMGNYLEGDPANNLLIMFIKMIYKIFPTLFSYTPVKGNLGVGLNDIGNYRDFIDVDDLDIERKYKLIRDILLSSHSDMNILIPCSMKWG
jgi:hypothetical protein